jgi:hypothetical protein
MQSMWLIYDEKFEESFFLLERSGGMKRNGELIFQRAILERVRKVM